MRNLALFKELSSPANKIFFIDLFYWPRILLLEYQGHSWWHEPPATYMNKMLLPVTLQIAAWKDIIFEPVKYLHRVGLLYAPVRFWPDIMLLEQDGTGTLIRQLLIFRFIFWLIFYLTTLKKHIKIFFKNGGQQRDSNHRPIDHESSRLTSTPARVLCRNIAFYPAWNFTE